MICWHSNKIILENLINLMYDKLFGKLLSREGRDLYLSQAKNVIGSSQLADIVIQVIFSLF